MKINHVVQSNPWIYSSGFFFLILSTAMGCKTHISPSQSMENSKTENTSNSTHGIQNVMLPSNTYCRAIVNTKDGYSTWVTFDKDKIDVTRHWGGIMNIEGEWVQIVKMSYLGKNKRCELVFLKNLHNKRYSYVNVYQNFLNEQFGLKYCFSYRFHYMLDRWGWLYREYADPFSLALDNVETLIKQQYDDFCANDVEDGYARSRSDELRGMYCEFDTPWMVYQNRPRYEYLCETHNLYTNIKVMETIGNMITVSSSIKTDTCLPRKEKLSNLDTVVIHKSEHNMGVFFAEEHSSALYSKKRRAII